MLMCMNELFHRKNTHFSGVYEKIFLAKNYNYLSNSLVNNYNVCNYFFISHHILKRNIKINK